MTRQTNARLRLGALLAAVAAPLLFAQEPAPKPPPHIIVILVDDLGWRDSAPEAWPDPDGPGARHFLTPNLARLASEGVRFSDGYASCAVCTPSRTSLMTGASPARNRITYWTRHPGRDTSARHPFVAAPAWNVDGLQPGDTTLAGLIADAGYHAIHVGKAHWGTGAPTEGTGADPLALGFDENIAGWAAGAPGSYYGVDDFGGEKRKARGGGGGGGTSWDVPGLEEHHGDDVFLTDVLAGEATRALRASVERGERVFLHFAPYAVHTPIMVNPRVAPRYPNLEGPELAYATLVTSVDDAVGRILDTLDALGIADETLVVYTSDNGGLSAHGRGGRRPRHGHNAPLRSGKGSAYEGGTRVPWIVRWPGVTEPGRVARGVAITHDLFPTLVAAAGASIPSSHAPRVEGIDLTPVLAGAEPPLRPLFWHMPHFWGIRGPGIEPYSAVRLGDHKLLWFHSTPVPGAEGAPPTNGGPRFELYDLGADLGETRDLAAEEPATVAALARVLGDWLVSTDAQLSLDGATGAVVAFGNGGGAARGR